jgi:hypothetical protein
MGKYLDILARVQGYEKNDINDESPSQSAPIDYEAKARPPFGRLSRFRRAFSALESHRPELVSVSCWQQCVEDGRTFLARWGEQAEALGWTAKDLFGLHKPLEKPHPSYSRLSRYDETGLIWLLCGREVVALTEATAASRNQTGNVTTYRRHNKPVFGPLGDSLNDFDPPTAA